MPNCKHYEICGLESIDSESLCILHSQNPKKDVNAFRDALEKHLQDQTRIAHDFKYFFFPEGATGLLPKSFEKDTVFNEATFLGENDLRWVKFNRRVSFVGSIFRGETHFSYAFFKAPVEFEKSIFGGSTFFNSTKFVREVNFGKVIFKGRTHFDHASFKRDVFFLGTIFGCVSEIVAFLFFENQNY